MAYKVTQFDGLILPRLMSNGDGDDIGSGEALTSFTQLPGGGFFDNYGAADSPQGIRPITHRCNIYGATQAEFIASFKALRGKIGRRGRLSIVLDDGEIWWQWARLQRLDTPRNTDALCNHMPCRMSFVTAAQMWYGLVQSGDSWSVGDESFYLGDGSTSLGMNDYLFELAPATDTIEVTLPNDGNTYVRNLFIELTTGNAMGFVEINNLTTGHQLTWTEAGHPVKFTLLIDTGAKSCLVRDDSNEAQIASARGRGVYVEIETAATHDFLSGESVAVDGTSLYDGIYHDITVVDSTHFTAPWRAGAYSGGQETTAGTARRVRNAWQTLEVSDRAHWFLLAEGDNELSITHTVPGTPASDYSIQFSWYAHFR